MKSQWARRSGPFDDARTIVADSRDAIRQTVQDP